jgi:hypothetical protein
MISYKRYRDRTGEIVVKTTLIPGELFASKIILRKEKKQGVKKPLKVEKKCQPIKQTRLLISHSAMRLRMLGTQR